MKLLACHPGAEMYGADRMFVTSTIVLNESGCTVIAAVPEFGPLTTKLRDAQIKVMKVDVPVLRKNLSSTGGILKLLLKTPRALWRSMQSIKQAGAETVYVNTVTQPWWIIAARLARRRVVVHVREAEPDSSSITRRLLIAPTRLAHLTICNSSHTRDFVISAGGRPDKTVVLYNGKVWKTDGVVEKPALRSDTVLEPITLLLLGRISPRKGTDLAITALGFLVDRGYDVRLRLVGSVYAGYEWYANQLSEMCRSLDVTERVDFVGYLEDPSSELAGCDIALVPSRVEPFGSVAVESMAYARPTIVANLDGLTEIVVDPSVGYTFCSEDACDLARVCESLIRNPVDARDVGRHSQEYVESKFSLGQYGSGLQQSLLKSVHQEQNEFPL